MRALTILALAASPLALAAPASAQSVIQDGRWVTGTPEPQPTPAPVPPPPVEEAPPVAAAPQTTPEAPIVAPATGPAPSFAPRSEVVQPLPPARTAPVARAAAPAPSVPAPAVGEAGALPPPPAVSANAAPPAGATYEAPVRGAVPARRAEAVPPAPAEPRRPAHVAEVPRHPALAVRDARSFDRRHHAREQRWGDKREGRWEAGWRAPGGWDAYRRPVQGWTLPRYWWSPEFVVVDYWTYDLPEPYRGERWVRYYDDAVLVDARGNVIDWEAEIDWDAGAGFVDYVDAPRYPDMGYGPDYPPPPYAGGHGGYIAGGYYYPPAVTHTIRVESQPVVKTRTYVTEEVVTRSGAAKGGTSVQRRTATKKCNC